MASPRIAASEPRARVEPGCSLLDAASASRASCTRPRRAAAAAGSRDGRSARCPSLAGRSSTLTRVRYCDSLSRLTVTRPSRLWPKLRTTLTALRNTSGMMTALPRFSQTPSCQRRHDAAQPAEVDQRRFAQGGAGDVRVHVDDVGAEGDVDRAGDAGPVGGQDQAARRRAGSRARRGAGPAPRRGPASLLAPCCGRRRRRRRPSRGPCRTGRPAAARPRPRWSCRPRPARNRGWRPSRSARRP